jgi:hypothetical protein
MRTWGRYTLLISLTLAVAAVAACTSAAGQARPATKPGPVFGIYGAHSYAAGKKINASFCDPAPMPGSPCGGKHVRHQNNPSGPFYVTGYVTSPGKVHEDDGPYYFRVRKGSLPAGLVLHSDGLLTGTVAEDAKVGRSPFTICVSETTSASTCDATSISITSSASRYDGQWSGAFVDPDTGVALNGAWWFGFDIHNGVITDDTPPETPGSHVISGTVASDGTASISAVFMLDDGSRCPASFRATFTTTGGLGTATSGAFSWPCQGDTTAVKFSADRIHT